ncbi:MAG: PIN domain-containing protein [Phycisphaerales bacterium JB039]
MNTVDTNVLIYAYDTRDPDRQARAVELLKTLSDGILLWQVACEFVAASRKLSSAGLTQADAWSHLEDMQQLLRLVTPSQAVLESARSIMGQHDFHFWDAMIYAACLEAGVERIYSEDLPGADISGLTVINPFAHPDPTA